MKPFAISPFKITGKITKDIEGFRDKILKKVKSLTGSDVGYELKKDRDEFTFHVFFPDVTDTDIADKFSNFLSSFKGMDLQLTYKVGEIKPIGMKKKLMKIKNLLADDILKIDTITKSFK